MKYSIVAKPAPGEKTEVDLSEKEGVTNSLVLGGVIGRARTRFGARILRAFHAWVKTNRWERMGGKWIYEIHKSQ